MLSKRSALLVVVVVLALCAPSFASEGANVPAWCRDAGLSVPWQIDRCPRLFTGTLESLQFKGAFDSRSVPAGGPVKSVEEGLRVVSLEDGQGGRYLLFAADQITERKRLKISFAQDVVLREISPLTGL